MAKKTKGLSPKEIRERQQEAGRSRLGPRIKPKKKAETSDAGYVSKNIGTRNEKRNNIITKRVMNAPKVKRREVIEKLADQYDISTKTVEYVARYWKST